MPSERIDPFEVIARFYDLDLEGYEDDVALYLEIALRGGGEVLELGCGTGRVALALARAGLAVTGVDVSAAMLDVARQRAASPATETPGAASPGVASPGVETPLTLVEGDMRDLDLGRRFATVLAPLGGLQHMETAADVAAALATVARHLAPDGVAAVDVEASHPEDVTPGPQPLMEHWTRPWRGGSVTKLVAVEGRPSLGRRDVTWHFDVQPAEGPLRRFTQHFTLRVIAAGELELAARLAGLRVVAWYGDYDRSPPADGDDRIVALLEHAP